jgi:NAD(P)H dehydrogenase (quinone)
MTNPKKIFILVGNPRNDSHSASLGDSYAEGARAAGHEVRMTRIADMKFDPILHKGYTAIQELEPDLKQFQEDVKWCDTYVTVFPIWWSDVPAILKGLVDRVWLPGFAYNFRKDGLGWIRRLKGKRARVIVTSDSHPLLIWILFGEHINGYVRGVLRFSGFAPVRRTWISGMKKMKPESWDKYLKKMNKLGRRGV